MAKYYIDPVSGTSGNNGTTEATPKQYMAEVLSAHALAPGDTVYFKRGTSGGGQSANYIRFEAAELAGVTIDGESYGSTSGAIHKFIGTGSSSAVHFNQINGITLVGCDLSSTAAAQSALVQANSITMLRCVISNATANGIGVNTTGSFTGLTLTDCTIQDCVQDGVYISADFGTLTMNDCLVQRCDTEADGGDCVQMSYGSGPFTLNNCTFIKESATKQAVILGSVDVAGQLLYVNGCTFIGVDAGYYGLGVLQGTAYVRNCTFSGFSATGGAAVRAVLDGTQGTADPVLYLDGCDISDCAYGLSVGAYGTLRAYNCDISSSERGVSIANATDAAATVKNCDFQITAGVNLHKSAAAGSITSDYNNYATDAFHWQGDSKTLETWRAASSQDANSELAGPTPATGTWIAGVRAADDLPLPLHPDKGKDQDRTAPGRRFGTGGGTL